MLRRMFMIVLALMLLLSAACAKAPEAEPAPDDTAEEEAAPAEAVLAPYDAAQNLIGFIFPGGGDAMQNVALHGFLRTAENLGYPSVVLRDGSAEALMAQALEKGCKGVVVWSKDIDVTRAMEAARSANIPSVAVYGRVEDLDSVNLFTDMDENDIEAVKLMKQELITRKHETGGIVLVTDSESDAAEVEAMRKALRLEAGAYTLMEYKVPKSDEETALAEAVQYYKENTHIVAAVCFSDKLSSLWSSARKKAETDLKPTPTPKGKATPTPKPTPTPSVTPTPAVTKLDTVIVGMDYTKAHVDLTKSGAIYGFIARPYFESGAQGCMLLDQMLRGAPVPDEYTLFAPLVRKQGCDKYESIILEVNEWFGG